MESSQTNIPRSFFMSQDRSPEQANPIIDQQSQNLPRDIHDSWIKHQRAIAKTTQFFTCLFCSERKRKVYTTTDELWCHARSKHRDGLPSDARDWDAFRSKLEAEAEAKSTRQGSFPNAEKRSGRDLSGKSTGSEATLYKKPQDFTSFRLIRGCKPPPERERGRPYSPPPPISDLEPLPRPRSKWSKWLNFGVADHESGPISDNEASNVAGIKIKKLRNRRIPQPTLTKASESTSQSPYQAQYPPTLAPITTISSVDQSYDIIMQPETRPITQEQLVAEVKEIYAGLVMVEAKCIEVDNKQAALAGLVMVEAKCIEVDNKQAALAVSESGKSSQQQLGHEQWQAMIALHRTLLHEHHDFFLASQHPSASPALRRLAAKYAMPARMWKHGIHSFLELFRRRLPGSLDQMLAFIYHAYSMMALLYETVPAFKDTWIECLGDLARYRMAIEDDGIRDREVWTSGARNWYSRALDRSSTTGRIHHHLPVLARPNALQQLFYYYKSLCVAIPFISARESILTLFDPILSLEHGRGGLNGIPIASRRLFRFLKKLSSSFWRNTIFLGFCQFARASSTSGPPDWSSPGEVNTTKITGELGRNNVLSMGLNFAECIALFVLYLAIRAGNKPHQQKDASEKEGYSVLFWLAVASVLAAFFLGMDERVSTSALAPVCAFGLGLITQYHGKKLAPFKTTAATTGFLTVVVDLLVVEVVRQISPQFEGRYENLWVFHMVVDLPVAMILIWLWEVFIVTPGHAQRFENAFGEPRLPTSNTDN